MVTYVKLNAPSFDLTWLEYHGTQYILCPGGGGSTRSGVKNVIQVYMVDQNAIKLHNVQETIFDGVSKFCFKINWNIVENTTVLYALYENSFAVMEIEKIDNKLRFSPKLTRPINSDKDATSIASTSDGFICIGGDDSTISVWKLSIDGDWEISHLRNLVGHKSSILGVSISGVSLLASASKDGYCKIWNFKTGTSLADMLFTPIEGGKSECRGCCFSSSEKVYTLNTNIVSKSYSTYLIEWKLSVDSKGNIVNFSRKRLKLVSKLPASNICLSSCREFIAVGISDGSIKVYSTKNLVQVLHKSVHQLPVTGMYFAPSSVAEDDGSSALLNSCSADYALSSIPISDVSFCSKFCIALFYIVIALIGALAMIIVFGQQFIPRSLLEEDDED